MTKSNKNLIFTLPLLVIFALSAVAFMPATADAQLSPLGGGSNMNFYGSGSSHYQNDNDPIITPAPARNPSPIIYSIDPSSAYSGSSGIAVVVNGANFVPSSIAKFNGSNRYTRYVDPTRLVMTLSDRDMTGLGNYTVTVYNLPPGGGYSNGVYFTLVKKTANAPATPSVVKKTTTAKKVVASTTKTDTCETNSDNNSLTASAIFGSNGFMPGSLMQWLLLLIMIIVAVILWRKAYVNKEKSLKHA